MAFTAGDGSDFRDEGVAVVLLIEVAAWPWFLGCNGEGPPLLIGAAASEFGC